MILALFGWSIEKLWEGLFDFLLDIPWLLLEAITNMALAVMRFFLGFIIEQGQLDFIEPGLSFWTSYFGNGVRSYFDLFCFFGPVCGAFGWYLMVIFTAIAIRVTLFVYHQFWGAN